MVASETKGSDQNTFKDWQKKIKQALDQANKDNDFIYHARIPELNSLAPIGKASPAKLLPVTSPMSMNFKGLYRKHSSLHGDGNSANFNYT